MRALTIGLLWLPVAAGAAEVGVLVEPGMVRYGAQPGLRPERVAALLADTGLAVTALGVADLPRAGGLDPALPPVLVVPYGNAFPLPAFEALRDYHRGGGGLVLNGIPFCHPCQPSLPAGWRGDGGENPDDLTWLPAEGDRPRAVRVSHRGGTWRGLTSPRLPARPGQPYRIAGQVRSGGLREERSHLFVRFFAGGQFVSQDGPVVPNEAAAWRDLESTVTVPAGADSLDVSLQVWTAGGWVELRAPHLATVEAPAANLLTNAGFTIPGNDWRDLGHVNYFGADEAGIGTGSFLGPEEGTLRLRADNPLGLTPAMFADRPARVQYLDAASLPAGAEVIPLVELRTAGGARPATVLIRHAENGPMRGARAVWIGQIAAEPTAPDGYFLAQLAARGVLWCLAERGQMPAPRRAALLARLDAQPLPEPLPDDLVPVAEPRPWGDTFFPKSPPPARTLRVVDVQPLGPAEKLALISLQGLTSRARPRLWLLHNGLDQRWLEWHRATGDIDGFEPVADWTAPFRDYRDSYRGAVVPDPEQYQGVLLACTLAGLEDLIVAPPELAERLGIPVVIDLRGRFATYAEGLRWLWSTYRQRLSHHTLSYAHPDTVYTGNVDFEIAHRALVFWISGDLDGSRPGADPLVEASVMGSILAALPPNIGLRGFPWHGEGVGMGEGGGVEFCGGYGKGLVCCNLSGNMSVTSGVRRERLTPPEPAPAPPLERDKVYVALTMSDGDNLNTWLHYFHRYFEHPSHGTIPMGWGMGPAILDLMPAVAEWYYRRATPNDEFLADVSGIAYVFPETYANRYRDPGAVLDGFTEWTARYLERTGMRSIRPHGGSRATIARMAAGLPMIHGVFADYARRGLPYDQAVWALDDGRPVFHAVTHWQYGADGLLRDIREQVGDRRPAFVNAFLHNWTFDMDALQRAYDARDADLVFVTPSQLSALYREAAGR